MKKSVASFCFLSLVLCIYGKRVLLPGGVSSPIADVRRTSNGGGVWTIPPNCNETTCRSVEWEPVIKDGVEKALFTIKGRSNGYISFVLFKDASSENGECFMCRREHFDYSRITPDKGLCSLGLSAPSQMKPVSDADVVYANLSDGHISCSFYRAFNQTFTISNGTSATNVSFDITTNKIWLGYSEGQPTNPVGEYAPPQFSALTTDPVLMLNLSGIVLTSPAPPTTSSPSTTPAPPTISSPSTTPAPPKTSSPTTPLSGTSPPSSRAEGTTSGCQRGSTSVLALLFALTICSIVYSVTQ